MTTAPTLTGYRHEFLREYLGKVIIGLFIAIAIRNTALEATHAWQTRAHELQRAAEATAEEFLKRNGYPVPSRAPHVLADPDTPRTTVYANEEDAIKHLAPLVANKGAPNCVMGNAEECKQEYREVERSRLSEHDLRSEVEDKLKVYHIYRLVVNVLLIFTLFLQTWHLYYTFRTLDEILSFSTPKYARLSDSVARKISRTGTWSLLPLTLVVVIIPFSAPQDGSSGILFWGTMTWSAAWCAFDILKIRMLRLHRNGAHADAKVADPKRWIGEIDDTLTWLQIDAGLLVLFIVVLGANMTIWAPDNDYDTLIHYQRQCAVMLFVIFSLGLWMFVREWKRRGQPEVKPMDRWNTGIAKRLGLD